MRPKSVNPVKSVTVGTRDRVRSTGKKVSQGVPPEGGTTDLLLSAAMSEGSRGTKSVDRVTGFREAPLLPVRPGLLSPHRNPPAGGRA